MIELKAFSKIENFSVYEINRKFQAMDLKPQHGIGKILEAIRVILQINARMNLKANNG